MHHIDRARRALLALALTATLVALASGSAAATQLSVGETSFRAVWTPARFILSSVTVGCNVTFEGSFHRTTFAKVARSLIGYITRATVNSCTAGTMSVLAESLPWHVQYGGFGGTLPDLTTMTLRVIGMSTSWTFIGITCLGRTEANSPVQLIAERGAGGTITGLRWDESLPIPLTGAGICSSIRGRVGGTSSAPTGSGGASISLTLTG